MVLGAVVSSSDDHLPVGFGDLWPVDVRLGSDSPASCVKMAMGDPELACFRVPLDES